MPLTPYFSFIRQRILDILEKADKAISVAVCWFTNGELFNLLCDKLDKGLQVELIILDDDINSGPFGCNFQIFIEKGGHLYLGSVDNPMHNKYCIIDGKILINGSYNWTNFAETRNEENIIVFEDCDELISSFRSDFERLKSIAIKCVSYKQKDLSFYEGISKEVSSRYAFSVLNIVSNELFSKAVAANNKTYYEVAKKMIPDNIQFQKKGIELEWDRPLKLKSSLSEAVWGDKIHLVFPVGTIIPSEASRSFTTVEDCQTSMIITLLRGENLQASKNVKLRHYDIYGLPPMKAGEVSIKTEYKISLDGNLYINKQIHDTGRIDKRVFNLKELDMLETN